MSKDCEAGFVFPENGHLGADAKIVKGLIVPVLTPFDNAGEIDQRAFIRHLEFLAQHGVRRIMVNGTTAEFYSLLPEERKTLLKVARRYFPRLIVLHVGGIGLAQNKEEMAWAAEYGADAVAALPPIYPAGLCAEGVTEIDNIHHIERGYENIVEKLSAVGADIKCVAVPEEKELAASAG